MRHTFRRLALAALLAPALAGCYAAMMAGSMVRAHQREISVVLTPGTAPADLARARNIGVKLQAFDARSGTLVAAVGSGDVNVGVYSDMLSTELLKQGYQASTLSEEFSEPLTSDQLGHLASERIDLLLLGNLNLSTTTNFASAMVGGDYGNTGVTSATLKCLDARTGRVLAVITAEYGAAKKASEVAADLSRAFADAVAGRATAQ